MRRTKRDKDAICKAVANWQLRSPRNRPTEIVLDGNPLSWISFDANSALRELRQPFRQELLIANHPVLSIINDKSASILQPHWHRHLVAVGTIIADRPPHRSVRARLRIRLF